MTDDDDDNDDDDDDAVNVVVDDDDIVVVYDDDYVAASNVVDAGLCLESHTSLVHSTNLCIHVLKTLYVKLFST